MSFNQNSNQFKVLPKTRPNGLKLYLVPTHLEQKMTAISKKFCYKRISSNADGVIYGFEKDHELTEITVFDSTHYQTQLYYHIMTECKWDQKF